MIYVDTSVALAQLLAEDRVPDSALWEQTLVSSRLLEYEVWNRINARDLAASHADPVRRLLARLAFVALTPQVLSRACAPFPAPTRTLDALHLASIHFMREQGLQVRLASYDNRMTAAARALGIPLSEFV